MKNNIKSIVFIIFLLIISCGEEKTIEKVDKCSNIKCKSEQTCIDGICNCNDNNKKLSFMGNCICSDSSQIIDKNGKCITDTNPPIIKEVASIDKNDLGFTLEKMPKYVFNSSKDGELYLEGDCTISNKPLIKKGNNTIQFDELYSGLYDNCEIWIIDKSENESNHLKLSPFTVFNVVNTQLIKGRNNGIGIDYVIIGDGFKKEEQELFKQKAQEFTNFILNYDPELTKQSKAWNIHLISLASKESGADYSNIPNTPELVDTGLDSHFNCNNIQRLLCINQSKVNFIVENFVPQFDKVLVIVNSYAYGGAGGNYATASINSSGKQIAIHELGHSFAGLADEYEYGKDSPPTTEPIQPNITINNDSNTIKWSKWLNEPNIGIFEGGGYVSHGVYRPTEDSLMRNLGKPLYQVNLEAWTLAFYKMVGGYLSKNPENDNLILWGATDYDFSIELSINKESQKVEWFIDGVKQDNIPEDTTSFRYGKQSVGKYQVKAVISDKSGIIRNDPNNISITEAIWNVTSE